MTVTSNRLLFATCLAIGCAGRIAAEPAESSSKPAQANERQIRTDAFGDPLPPGAIARLGTTRLYHPGACDLLFSPDAKTLASVDPRGTVKLWDLSTGKEIRQLTPASRVSRPSTSTRQVFSADGKALFLKTGDQTPRLWDIHSGTEIRKLPWSVGSPIDVAFSRDGRYVAACNSGGTIQLWDALRGTPLGQWSASPWPTIVGFSADSKTLVSGGRDPRSLKTIVFCEWALPTGAERGRHKAVIDNYTRYVFSPDSKLFAARSDEGNVLRLWESGTGRRLQEIRTSGNTFDTVAFSADSQLMATAGERDRSISVRQTHSGKVVRQFQVDSSGVQRIALSRDGQILASVGEWNDAIRIWDVETGKERISLPGHRNGPLAFAFAAGRGESVTSIVRPHELPDRNSDHKGMAPSVYHWEPGSGRLQSRLQGGPGDAARWEVLSPDGRLVAMVSQDGLLRVRDSRSARELGRWQVGILEVWRNGRKIIRSLESVSLSFSADSQMLIAYNGGLLRRWSLTSQQELNSLRVPAEAGSRLLPSPDGKYIAVIGRDEDTFQILLLDAATARLVRRFRNERGLLGAIAFSPDGRSLAVAEGKRIRLLELSSGQERASWEGSSETVHALAFSPNGQLLASGSGDQECGASLWRPENGRQLCEFRGHTLRVDTLAFSPDGRLLVSGGHDNTALVWDRASFRLREPLAATKVQQDIEELWPALLSENAQTAYQALAAITTAPAAAIPVLVKHLSQVRALDTRSLDQLIADLDNNRFSIRQSASAELKKYGRLAESAYHNALAGKPSLELRQRVERLLAEMDDPPPEWLRAIRAVEALEQIGNADARLALERLARATPRTLLTQQATASLERLARRPLDRP